jgi:beta-xylosidase
MFVYGADWPNSDIYVSTASKLEGPWTSAITLGTTCPTGTCGDLRYCIAPHPEFDASGKTLMVTWTDDNDIHAVEITWH